MTLRTSRTTKGAPGGAKKRRRTIRLAGGSAIRNSLTRSRSYETPAFSMTPSTQGTWKRPLSISSIRSIEGFNLKKAAQKLKCSKMR